MSKYIDMITAENKTLKKKYDEMKLENERILQQNQELRKDRQTCLEENRRLKSNQCNNNHMCNIFTKELNDVMSFANLLSR